MPSACPTSLHMLLVPNFINILANVLMLTQLGVVNPLSRLSNMFVAIATPCHHYLLRANPRCDDIHMRTLVSPNCLKCCSSLMLCASSDASTAPLIAMLTLTFCLTRVRSAEFKILRWDIVRNEIHLDVGWHYNLITKLLTSPLGMTRKSELMSSS